MNIPKFESSFSNIFELDSQYLISWVFALSSKKIKIEQIVSQNNKNIFNKQLNIEFNQDFQITSIQGYYTKNIGILIGTQSGILLHIENQVKEYWISASPLIDIVSYLQYFLINSADNAVHLYDVEKQCNLLTFSEYLGSPIQSIGVRAFYDVILQGRGDGYLTYYKCDESLKCYLEKQVKPKQVEVVAQSYCRLCVTTSELLDFILYGEMVITSQKDKIQLIYVDVNFGQYICIKQFEVSYSLNMLIYQDRLVVGGQDEIISICMNNGQQRTIKKFNQETSYCYNGILSYIDCENKLQIE